MAESPHTPRQLEHLDGILTSVKQRMLRELKPSSEELQRLFRREGEFQNHFLDGVRRLCAAGPEYQLAKTILKGDFITPEEVVSKRPIQYTEAQILALSTRLPGEQELHWLKKNGYALMALPPSPMSLLEVRSLKPLLFFMGESFDISPGGNFPFTHDEKTDFSWIAVRKTIIEDSRGKSWWDQIKLLTEAEKIPTAVEFAWFVTTFYEVRGVSLFTDVVVRVSSQRSFRQSRVGLGNFDIRGLRVEDCLQDDAPMAMLALTSCKKY